MPYAGNKFKIIDISSICTFSERERERKEKENKTHVDYNN